MFPEFCSVQSSVFTRHCRRNLRPDSWPLGISDLSAFKLEVFVMSGKSDKRGAYEVEEMKSY